MVLAAAVEGVAHPVWCEQALGVAVALEAPIKQQVLAPQLTLAVVVEVLAAIALQLDTQVVQVVQVTHE
jgi:hypothetical protein